MNTLRLLLLTFAGVAASETSFAETLYATSDAMALTGSRTLPVSDGVDAIDGGNLGDFGISWSITPSQGIYHYVYTLMGSSGPGLGVGHFSLELSDSITSVSACITNATVNDIDVQPTLNFGTISAANGNPGLPTAFYGVRFEPAQQTQLPVTVAFDSDRAPVWGDFYLKLGRGTDAYGGAAWNSGNTLTNVSTNYTDFVPRPDTFGVASVPSVPEPAGYLLVGGGLASLGLIRRRQRR